VKLDVGCNKVLDPNILQTEIEIGDDLPPSRSELPQPRVMPPKAKQSKQDKSKASSDEPKKLKAANAVKVRHILCEKQSKGTSFAE
jgi:hypothetical protein